jgi:integrase
MGLSAMRGQWQYRFRLHGQDVCFTTDLEATERNRKRAEQLEAHRQNVQDGEFRGAERPSLFVLYDLRHTFATRMVEAGIDVYDRLNEERQTPEAVQ